jgi:hypothetical protein
MAKLSTALRAEASQMVLIGQPPLLEVDLTEDKPTVNLPTVLPSHWDSDRLS